MNVCNSGLMTDAPASSVTGADDPNDDQPSVTDAAKLIRLGTMVQTLMDEVRSADTDEQSRMMLARIHNETVEELSKVLSTDLMDELSEFAACCDEDGVPTESEIRVAQAQLVGWMQGLLQGLQASMVAQQAAAADQLNELQTARAAQQARRGDSGDLPQQAGTYL